MANYTTTITNEGAALLASVIANQGTLTFNEFRFSENDYNGQESTLTEGTFLGVFITASAAASVIDSTTIKASAQFNNSTITGNHDLYSIGIVGTDGNTTALIAVCTTTDPDVIREPLTGTSTYAFNVNLTVSNTNDITVVGTVAGIQYEILSNPLVIDGNTETTVEGALDGLNDYGNAIAENLAVNENVYGAKNQLEVTALSQTVNDVVFTINEDKSITTSGQANAETYLVIGEKKYAAGTYTLTGSSGLSNQYMYSFNVDTTDTYVDTGSGVTFTLASESTIRFLIYVQSGASATETYYPMLRDARILDPTFAPYAMTNREITERFNNDFLIKSFNIPSGSIQSGAYAEVVSAQDIAVTGYELISVCYYALGSYSGTLICQFLIQGNNPRIELFNAGANASDPEGIIKCTYKKTT